MAKTGLLEKMEQHGIDKVLRLLIAPKGIGKTAGTAIGGAAGGPAGAMVGGVAGSGIDALRSLLFPEQQQPMNDLGYNPMGQMVSPYQQMNQGMSPFLQGGMQGLGNFVGNQAGSSMLNLMQGLGESEPMTSSINSTDVTNLLDKIPEDIISKYLMMRQARK